MNQIQKRKNKLDGADHTFLVFSGDLTMLEKLTDETISRFEETL